MPTPIELCECVSSVTGFSYSTVDTVWKALRANGDVPNAGKGKAAPDIRPGDAAVLLTALCGVTHVRDSVDAVRRLRRTGFVDALTELLVCPRRATVLIHAEKPEAFIDDARFTATKATTAFGAKSPIDRLGDAVFIRGFSATTLEAVHRLFNPPSDAPGARRRSARTRPAAGGGRP